MHIKPLRGDLENYLKVHTLSKKYEKAKMLFENNPFHPSLNTEILEPKERLVYLFRLNKKHRAIFIDVDVETVEIMALTNHYK